MRVSVSLIVAALAGFATVAQAASPAPATATPELIDAARREGKVVYYTAIDVKVAQGLAKAFEKAYPGVAVQVERTGSERIFQRVAQERASNIFAVDVLDGSDQAMFVTWKKQGLLDPYIPAEAMRWPIDQRDPDGTYISVRYTLMPIAYNSTLVKPQDAPKSFSDLLDPKWSGKMVKAHPSYSGGIVTSTFQTMRVLGWDYFKKLGQQKVMQVQSATEPPKKLALGERAVAFDGLEYVHILEKERGAPIEIVYPSEGTPFIPGCEGIAAKAPHPNAARLFMHFMVSRETQQYLSDVAGLRSFHPEVTLKSGRTPVASIKLMKSDPDAQEAATDEIKNKYRDYFGI